MNWQTLSRPGPLAPRGRLCITLAAPRNMCAENCETWARLSSLLRRFGDPKANFTHHTTWRRVEPRTGSRRTGGTRAGLPNFRNLENILWVFGIYPLKTLCLAYSNTVACEWYDIFFCWIYSVLLDRSIALAYLSSSSLATLWKSKCQPEPRMIQAVGDQKVGCGRQWRNIGSLAFAQ